MSRWHRDELGANAVEFALLLPILLMILFGTITGGMLYNQQLTLTQAAREGARYGATMPVDAQWEERVKERVEQVSGGMVGEDDITLTEPTEATDGRLTVRVERPGRLEIVLGGWNITLSAESVARHESVGVS
jgi:Flp pilus assembly protein TadG